MPQAGVIHPLIDEGIDRKALNTLRKRFTALNQTRLRRVLQALPTRQYNVLQLIPLLFDVNYHLLPGFVSRETPHGLAGYEPETAALQSAQALTRSYQYRRHPAGFLPQIIGLYLMGSGGTIGQSEHSDLDIWVCHQPDLSETALAELTSKCQRITDWAATQGSEAHFHLINPTEFSSGARNNELAGEDCGSTQHYLLLDEFYRTAIMLGGRYPLWWLVPAYEEHQYDSYAEQLLSKRFVRGQDSLDFGHVAGVPAGEFVGAGLWQLYKGIDSPYKSVLKLLLTEVYSSEHPQVRCLSLDFKAAIYNGQLDADELDPYVMLYRRIERYLLNRKELERLELLRRCLYIKANVRLSKRSGLLDWKRNLMEKLVREWQWGPRQLQQMDSRQEWRIREVSTERRQLVNELTHSYRLLSHFGRSHGVINQVTSRDLSLLGRRLYAAFERKAGKIEFINPGISPDLSEDLLTLAQAPATDYSEAYWNLYQGSLSINELGDHPPLKRSRRLMELLAWGHRNGMIDSATRFALYPGDSTLSEFELSNLVLSLQQQFPLPLPALTETALSRASEPCHVLLLVNIGLDPLPSNSQHNLHMISSHTDALGYSGMRDNLILSIDQVSLNSWNEMLVTHYEGEEACMQALCDYLNQGREHKRLPELQVRCFCRNRSSSIAERVEGLFRDAAQHLLANPPDRFLVQVQNGFRLLEWRDEQINMIELADRPALLRNLGRSRPRHSKLALDAYALQGQDLALILQHERPGRIQLFYRIKANWQVEVSLLDERGALWTHQQSYRDEQTMLLPLLRFLNGIRLRRQVKESLESSIWEGEVQLYAIQPAHDGNPLRLEEKPLPRDGLSADFYAVQAIAEPSGKQGFNVTIFCDHREFSELEHGTRLYAEVAKHILSQRQSREAYPCYITDLDLSAIDPGERMQTAQYLRYRQQLERALNQAMGALR
ncbi:class I adenylate cyclase [Pseudomonas sp. 5Ae-yellow]|uniref:class I adenylate cyclase n=1 Tax=Pseudomonas sp. 5Ae-yellow TaxID=2759848 RepID=UPI0015F5F41D|nr:class I adenylate cyclase [Pseudomonas sp. 5Ae-yellow]MBA6419837.1 class I adenylate cyclase [Pseudomonas sp. 5Ae-yellow]|tara:strand:+ start:2685 stop:5525 length:2841 start_codon:yes stop_codon:yes gene_type:complete